VSAIHFDPTTAEFLADPYPHYERLRAADPVHWCDAIGAWVVTRYDDVGFVLSDPRFSAAERPPQRRPGRPTTMVTADPPDHARLRRAARRRFTARAVERLRPRMQQIVDEALAHVEAGGRMDIVWQLAYPLPVTVIAEVLGLPAADRERFKRWSDAGVMGVAGRFAGSEPARRTDGGETMDAYLRRAIDEHRDRPRDDAIGDLIDAERSGQIDADELHDTTAILLTAGNETTTGLIANGALALLRHPDQLALLRDEPSRIDRAIEELLRFEPPVQGVTRRAAQPVALHGRTIEPGQVVVAALGAANRDPERFARPEELDITRAENPHLSFGMGIHVCLGATLARAEARLAIGALACRFPRMRLAEEPRWAGNFILRWLTGLVVEV
jgi:cytochrome P450